MKPLVSLLLFLAASQFSIAQDINTTYADSLYDIGNYESALIEFQNKLDLATSKYDLSLIHLKIGECYEALNIHSSAYEHYLKSYKLDKSYKDVYWSLGESLRSNGLYSKSNRFFKKYMKYYPDEELNVRAKITSNDSAIIWMSDQTDVVVSPLNALNTAYFDFSPCFLDKEGKKMIFTSTRQSKDKDEQVGGAATLYTSQKDSSNWRTPKQVYSKELINSSSGVVSIDYTRNVAFFTKCQDWGEGERRCRIYYTFLQGDMIGEAFELSLLEDDNSVGVIGHPSYSNQLNKLFFVSDKEGGQGNRDVWCVTYDSINDSWINPQNLGPEINSSKNELFPFIASDNTLYFSSYGREGFGGLDIFQSKYLGNGKWAEAKNMKQPINSPSDDFGIVFSNDLQQSMFSSNRMGGLGKDDIYQIVYNTEINNELKTISSVDYNEGLRTLIEKEQCRENQEIQSNFKLINSYPNPVNDELTLEVISETSQQISLRVFNSKGVVLFKKNQVLEVGSQEFKIPFTNLSAGVYYISISDNCSNLQTIRVIKG